VTAAYLARAGVKPLVLERREMLGGCSVTEEIWPGFRVSTGAYLTSLLLERIIEDLDLPRFGYHVDAKDPSFFSPFPDGRYLFFWGDERKTLAEIAKFSRKDAERFPAYEAHMGRLSRLVEGLLLTTPPNFPPAGVRDLIDYLKLLARFRKVPAKDLTALVQVFTQSAVDFLERWFESEELKVTLATDAVIGASGGPRSPGTAYILLHHTMGGVAGHRGLWGFVRGGMGAVPEAIAASARSRGAVIRTGAPVAGLLVRGGTAEGCAGERREIRARIVVIT
jgi:phytoene dehydrogenase-like protein